MATIENKLGPSGTASRKVVVVPPKPAKTRHPVQTAVRAAVQSASADTPHGSTSPTTSIQEVLKVFAVGLLLATIFAARGLVHSGHGMDDGPQRTVTLGIGSAVLAVTEAVHLTWPWDETQRALGRGPLPDNSPLLATSPASKPTVPASAAPKRPRPPALFVPTPRHPLRLLITGDSLTEYLGPQMVEMTAGGGRIKANSDTHYGTGLVRPDFVDWSVVARQQIGEYHPAAVVVFIGGNDFQNISLPDGRILAASSPAWTREYSRRAEVVMRTWLRGGARRVYWLSMPPARSNAWSHNNAQIDVALRQAAKQVPGAEYLNILGPITNHGHYSDYVYIHGQPVLVRTPDGIHLTETGSSIVANEVLTVLREQWHLKGRPR